MKLPSWRFGRADLAQRQDVTFTLLADARWKKRAVEEITIASALSLDSRRSFQCADLGEALGRLRPGWASHASLVLPLTTLPKRPLLGFDVSAPDRTVANLPPRGALAELEANFVLALARGVPVDARLRTVLVKICEFSPGRWERWLPQADFETRVRSYIESRTGWHLTPALVDKWLAAQAPVRAALSAAIGLPPDETSSSENPVLVLPLLRQELGIDPPDALALLSAYSTFVDRCAALPDVTPFGPHAVLGEYGRRWEVMIECTVPLDGPFIVRMSERRPLELGRFGRANLDVTTGDALSNHTVVRVADENVRLVVGDDDAYTIEGVAVGPDEFDSVRITREECAIYASEPEREYRISLRVRLTAVWHTQLTNAVIALLIVLSGGLVARMWSTITADDLAVIVIPTTFAASLAVTRERTTLATHLLAPWRFVLLALTVALWLLAGAVYLGDTRLAHRPTADDSCHTPRVGYPHRLPHVDARSCHG